MAKVYNVFKGPHGGLVVQETKAIVSGAKPGPEEIVVVLQLRARNCEPVIEGGRLLGGRAQALPGTKYDRQYSWEAKAVLAPGGVIHACGECVNYEFIVGYEPILRWVQANPSFVGQPAISCLDYKAVGTVVSLEARQYGNQLSYEVVFPDGKITWISQYNLRVGIVE